MVNFGLNIDDECAVFVWDTMWTMDQWELGASKHSCGATIGTNLWSAAKLP